MKQLDEMERRIAFCLDDQWSQYRDLARFLRAVMPTIRAALDWHRVNTGQHTNGPQHTLAMRDTRRALVDAIDTLRRGMGEE